MASQVNFIKHLTAILLKLFQKIAEKVTLPKSFYEAMITLISKPDKDTTKKEKYRPVSVMKCTQAPQHNISKQIQQYIKRIIHHDQVGFILGMQGFFNIHKSV